MTRQVQGNPVVEMCAFNPASMTQVRVRGVAEVLDDRALVDEIAEARPFLKGTLEAIGYDTFLLFKLTSPKATVWTMETNFAAKEWVEL